MMIVVAYDGTGYSGFASQKDPKIRTIEGELNRALSELTGEQIEVCGASRTDAGVHALCNYAVFDTCSPIPAEKFAMAVNTHLPSDIRVRKSMEVPESFHPRTLRTEKTYEYRIYCAGVPDPLRERYFAWTYFPLDVRKMQRAAKDLAGEHDFASFCNPAGTTLTTVRTITDIQVEERLCSVPDLMRTGIPENDLRDEAREIIFRVSGTGFLYNMVRIIAGTLIRVGRGQTAPDAIPDILEKKDRQAAGDTAPACGLCLVNYRILGEKNGEKNSALSGNRLDLTGLDSYNR